MATIDPKTDLDEIAKKHREWGIRYPILNIKEQIDRAKDYLNKKEKEKEQLPTEHKG